MKLKEIENKEVFLKENYPFANVPKLGDKKHCLHCNKTITVGDYKVETLFNALKGANHDYIVCPNAPECDGNCTDWMDLEPED